MAHARLAAVAELDRPMVPVLSYGTQMEDKMVELGVNQAQETEMNDDDFHLLLQEARSEIDVNSFKSVEQLVDEQVDEETLEFYRRKRMAEMIAKKSKEKFGSIIEIVETQFEDEVKKAGCFVVMLIYRPELKDCQVIESSLSVVARKFSHLKFCKIQATGKNIKNFPLIHCPTCMIYNEVGGVMGQFVTSASFNGLKTTPEVIEWEFAKMELLDSELEEDPRETDAKCKFNMKQNFVGRSYKNDSDLEESDSD